MANYSYFYPGGNYGLDSDSGEFIGYRLPGGQIGTSLRPDTAAQIVEANTNLSQGFKQIEIGSISGQIQDQIPKQHFKEMGRLSKLTGSKVSVHAPIQDVEASGMRQSEGGGGYDEMFQKISEQKLKDTIDKAHMIDPENPTPVTMHSANMAGTEFVRGEKGEFKERQIVAVDQSTGQIKTVFKEEERYYPETVAETGESLKKSPQQMLDNANASQWRSKIENFASLNKNTDEIIGRSLIKLGNVVEAQEKGVQIPLGPEEQMAVNQLNKAKVFVENAESTFNMMFEEAYKYQDENTIKGKEAREKLKKLAKTYSEEVKKIYDNAEKKGYFIEVEKDGKKNFELNPNKEFLFNYESVGEKQRLLSESLQKLSAIKSPEIFKKVEDFAINKSADTFSNVALHSYKKYGKNAPIVSIENMYTGMAYANPKDFMELIKKSRNQFVEKAVKDGMSKSQAKKAAEQVIGITWDVGHLNMLKKQGFKEEDLIKATKLVGKDVKHVHLSDNFGYEDSHLPMGMGNVPTKEHLEALEKAGALKKGTMMINEIGGFVNQFKTSPFPYMLEAFGSPIVGTSAPYFSQEAPAPYFAGYGTMLPEQHFSMYGSGFSTLPTELGGQVQGGQSRFSGTPNA